ncbi:hypothetical protein NDU88_001736 [Pleurodeles waltl]|uniref:Transmembrane protein 128 n=1 Tax=Pleurodeles waltl TaxID=8319 RepID=A0AAV7WLU5_PLEWA|nr:hypothetical protein NDU88_001736 [Pleurodeles waltl]
MAVRVEDEDLQRVRRRFHQQAALLLQRNPEAESESDEKEKTKQKPLRRVNVHSVFWILASVAATYYVEFFNVFKEHLHEGSVSLIIGSLFLVASLAVALYCIIYLEWRCGIADYDAKYPALVPIAITTFLVASICYNVAFWPVWSYLTPLLLFTQFMGLVMLVALFG